MDETQVQRGWITETKGEFAGWLIWPSDKWEMHGGPFYLRKDADGSVRGAFRAAERHMNSLGHMHGGAMMTFADFFTFALADPGESVGTVTVTLNCEFVRTAQAGDLVEATGQVVKAGRRLVFVRGVLSVAGKAILNFSATLMRTAPL